MRCSCAAFTFGMLSRHACGRGFDACLARLSPQVVAAMGGLIEGDEHVGMRDCCTWTSALFVSYGTVKKVLAEDCEVVH